MSYYRPTSGLLDLVETTSGRPKITIIKPSQQAPTSTNPVTGTPMPVPAAPPSGGDAAPGGATAPPAASIGGGIPWMLPAIGLVAVGGFLLWRRHKKKGATP